ncbi:tetratricopeptide repeat protein [Hominifimenecus sp. rT4P-3]|uniref:tetratricopeptide repeat protein n=1 Tax=Hominifimenecus sp. rT4P-3 TaxID=3242979 RepID=UPI003DA41791
MDIQSVLQQLDQLFAQKRLSEVEPFLDRQLQQAIEEGDAASSLTLMNEMAGFYRSISQSEKSLAAAEDALNAIRQMNLSGTMAHATTLLNAATAYRAAGDLTRALSLYQEAFTIFQELRVDQEYPMAGLMNNMSQVYQALNRHEDAIFCLNRALEILTALSDAQMEIATTHSNLALSLLSMGKIEEARAHLAEAAALFEAGSGPRDAHYGAALAGLAELSYRTGDYAQAVNYYERALSEIRSSFGENDSYQVTKKNLELAKKAWEENKGK